MEPTVLILAAGLGTRMKSRKAKVLHHAGGRTLIEHVTGTALRLAPPERVFAVVGHQAEQVRATVAHTGIGFIEQAEQRGTGHAVIVGRDRLSPLAGPLLVLYGDCPLLTATTLQALQDRRKETGAAVVVLTTRLDDPTGYGRIIHDECGNIAAIVEQKAASAEQLRVCEINTGIYCFDSGLLWRHIDEIGTDNPAAEYYLTDIVGIFRRHGLTAVTLRLDDPREVLGINTRLELALVDRICRQVTVERLMLSGVTIEKPETVTIDDGVRIGTDTVVEPFAQILGTTEIGDDCRIGACSIVRDSRLGRRVVVEPFTLVGSSTVEDDARIGPFARLRLDNHVGAGGHIGNFVELKKTRLGRGSKANHLAYLGDSNIGEKVNVGAGTITCNYDGVHKHATQIGDGAFIGSNATLVAPLEVGANSYVGAGSVITDPVPPDALALGRGRQVVKEGWARKRRAEAAKK